MIEGWISEGDGRYMHTFVVSDGTRLVIGQQRERPPLVDDTRWVCGGSPYSPSVVSVYWESDLPIGPMLSEPCWLWPLGEHEDRNYEWAVIFRPPEWLGVMAWHALEEPG